ncbi:MAG: hypothetical protein JO079_11060 [Frankiaceae bacterium]|nr:hypothetical protein [Frankiaceae bacterium]MBV9369386.1 hypothetical protein [Frankiales bacterium]
MSDEPAGVGDGRYVVPTAEDLGLRPTPDPAQAGPATHWYPRRQGEALAYQRRWMLRGALFLVVVLVLMPLVWSVF